MNRPEDIRGMIAADAELHRRLETIVSAEYDRLMNGRIAEFQHLFVKRCGIERDIASLDGRIAHWLKNGGRQREADSGTETMKLLALLREQKEQLREHVERIGKRLADAKRETAASIQKLHRGQCAVRSYGVVAGNR